MNLRSSRTNRYNYRHPADVDPVCELTQAAGPGGAIRQLGRRQMKLKTQLSVLIAVIGVLGCASTDIQRVSPCNSGVCKVDVSITACSAPGGVAVDPPTLPVPVRQANNIEWTIVTPGYTFAQNGIVIADYYKQFDPPHLTGSGRKITVHNRNTNSGPVYYSVNVMMGATPCVALDPWIFNQ